MALGRQEEPGTVDQGEEERSPAASNKVREGAVPAATLRRPGKRRRKGRAARRERLGGRNNDLWFSLTGAFLFPGN
jgi:hypothetical protein